MEQKSVLEPKEGGRKTKARLTFKAALWFALAGFLAFIALTCIVMETRDIVTYPEQGGRLLQAAFIRDGRVDPANEGKDVIVVIDMDKCLPAEDSDTKIRFDFPLVRRQDEAFEKVRKTRSTGGGKKRTSHSRTEVYYEWEWVTKGSRLIWGGCPGFEFVIPDSVLAEVTTSDRVESNEMDDSAATLRHTNDGSRAYFEWGENQRCHYETNRGLKTIAVVGIQRGNEVVGAIATKQIFENIETAEQLVSEDRTNTIAEALILVAIFGVGFLLLAWLCVRKGRKAAGRG